MIVWEWFLKDYWFDGMSEQSWKASEHLEWGNKGEHQGESTDKSN